MVDSISAWSPWAPGLLDGTLRRAPRRERGRGRVGWSRTAEPCEDRQKFFGLHRLDEVVVETSFFRGAAIAFQPVAGESDEAHRSVPRIGLDAPRDLESIHTWKPHIQDDDIRRYVVDQGQRAVPVTSAVTGHSGMRQHRAEHL